MSSKFKMPNMELQDLVVSPLGFGSALIYYFLTMTPSLPFAKGVYILNHCMLEICDLLSFLTLSLILCELHFIYPIPLISLSLHIYPLSLQPLSQTQTNKNTTKTKRKSPLGSCSVSQCVPQCTPLSTHLYL